MTDVWRRWNSLAKAVEWFPTSCYACVCTGHEASEDVMGRVSVLDVNGRLRQIVGRIREGTVASTSFSPQVGSCKA